MCNLTKLWKCLQGIVERTRKTSGTWRTARTRVASAAIEEVGVAIADLVAVDEAAVAALVHAPSPTGASPRLLAASTGPSTPGPGAKSNNSSNANRTSKKRPSLVNFLHELVEKCWCFFTSTCIHLFGSSGRLSILYFLLIDIEWCFFSWFRGLGQRGVHWFTGWH